ncbi:hypothetical protein EST38_g2277 [Candolleomyces aberdarensis]|uniref:C2H2-type domain-containing protein n=1 Tax=Candolleomyces aberdarensis TaxID=2316362 RepID=A0A4Q2DU06_9AGAR|nr:hypothetical protein EST38_g2277 [Candolleomyces aberdarensis]
MPYHCSNCKKKSLKEEVIKDHCKTTGHIYKLQTCTSCNRFFGSVYDLHNHNMSLHPELGNYMRLKMRGNPKHREKKRKFKANYGAGPGAHRCTVCYKEFKTASACVQHLRVVHGRVGTNSGPTLGTVTANYGVRPGAYRCTVCYKEFKTASARAQHLGAVHRRVSTSSGPPFATTAIAEEDEEELLDSDFNDDEFAAGDEPPDDEGEFGLQLAWVEQVSGPSSGNVLLEETPGPPLFQAEIQDLVAAFGALKS